MKLGGVGLLGDAKQVKFNVMCLECKKIKAVSRSLCKSCYHLWYMRIKRNPGRQWPYERSLNDNRNRPCDYQSKNCNNYDRYPIRGLCKYHYNRLRRKGMLRIKVG